MSVTALALLSPWSILLQRPLSGIQDAFNATLSLAEHTFVQNFVCIGHQTVRADTIIRFFIKTAIREVCVYLICCRILPCLITSDDKSVIQRVRRLYNRQYVFPTTWKNDLIMYK